MEPASTPPQSLKVALAQIAPVWLNRDKTLERIAASMRDAGKQGCELIVFGEALLPGYPFWVALTNGSDFDSPVQKALYAHYAQNAIQIEKGDLNGISALARELGMAVYLGTIERAVNRGGHSLYCSLVYIDARGEIQSVHRKLRPTYEERLVWSPGDGNGLRTHPLKAFTAGGLNCWENWMPLPRAALYGMGENLHIAVWPGSDYNTADITRFIARESRSYVLSVSSLLRTADIPKDLPHREAILENAPEVLANGGSCIAGPSGEWVIPPVIGKEGLITCTLDFNKVLEERQNFDVSGHYARPDVTRLSVNRQRQSVLDIQDGE
ncbi:carbon-nitrogen hydrolase family protein [Robiginitalea sp. M366]|uniref:carbon-nitrogen hydrolase family protein n=1 Tax=Robiginitalea aestuariiviva TaxID=3036903 RepID=UPI00240D6208|nr:carbon-nitrogen hydrolase family protein [Robiginitalea aestuariiviva]MDG1571246.1 carbon-nitrogen hydrolase family protein [Robiginitalea aestuariiviva]